jgi:hypothetical protein
MKVSKYDKGEEIEFIAQSVKSDVDMAKVADAIKALEQEPVLDKIRAEIAEYGSICVEYKLTLTDRRDKDIEQLVTDVLKQAKKQVLDIIDKYNAESEGQAN